MSISVKNKKSTVISILDHVVELSYIKLIINGIIIAVYASIIKFIIDQNLKNSDSGLIKHALLIALLFLSESNY
jgi:hypothetical protein